jgi:dihydrofolate reductase
MVMGRRTFDSLPGLLPGRRHIVLTRDPAWRAEGAETARSPEEALALAGETPVSVIGGAEIIALFLPRADAVELTEVHSEPEADTFMPAFEPRQWREFSRQDHPSENGRPAYSFVRLERLPSPPPSP